MIADVILPLPLSDKFSYEVPKELIKTIQVGCRVIVPFGKRKYYTAIVTKLHNEEPLGFALKEIHSLIDTNPIVYQDQLELWEWISFYYLSPLGDVYKAALPSKLRMESETFVSATCQSLSKENQPGLTATEKRIVDYLHTPTSVKISVLERETGIKNALPHIYSLLQKNVVNTTQTIEQSYLPKTEKQVQITSTIDTEKIYEIIGRAKKQHLLFERIQQELAKRNARTLSRKTALSLSGATPSALDALIKKGILQQATIKVQRIPAGPIATRQPFPLSAPQARAEKEIESCFEKKKCCLLHGVTSSGKTEIYIHQIMKMLTQEKQTLYLVPEIALTTQLISRLQTVLGNQIGVYHSKINDNERTEIWHKMLSDNPYKVIIGVRSSLFLPFQRLGLIIVDEEHESGYKQQEPAPRYHARDTAVMMAHLWNANALLGTATPSIESYHNAQTGKYGYVSLTNRYEDIKMPEIQIENTFELHRKKKMKSLLAPQLIEEIRLALGQQKQVILFRNRRGFAPMLECQQCAWTPKCKVCDVTLTYHKYRNRLVCHYCNASYSMPDTCPACGNEELKLLGQGTEQLEEEVARLFPDAAIARMDADTTRKKNAYERIIADFQEKKIQILIGTQMLSKGLDFDHVRVVGIIAADALLNYPDFRSHERGFQLMTQAAGRAGRKNKQGKVIIQAASPQLPIYQSVVTNDYERFFREQITERKLFRYPPFARLILIVFKHKKEETVHAAADFFATRLRRTLHERVLGANKPVVGRVQSLYIRHVMLKLEVGLSPGNVRKTIKDAERECKARQTFRSVMIYYDVDPM